MATTQKPALPWNSAARIAWRELGASRTKFLFVLLSVAIGVAALTGVRGFSESFQRALLQQARSIMAGDLSARMFQQPTEQQQEGLKEIVASGVGMMPVTGIPLPLMSSGGSNILSIFLMLGLVNNVRLRRFVN